MVIYSYREQFLGSVLADDILVEIFVDILRLVIALNLFRHGRSL